MGRSAGRAEGRSAADAHAVEVSPEALPASALLVYFETSDADGLLAALPRISEEVRAEAWEALRRPLSSQLGPDDRLAVTDDAWNRRLRTRSLMALAVGPPDVVRRVVGPVLRYSPTPAVDRVVASRSTAWREAFTDATLHAWASEREVGLMGPFWWEWWQQLRRLEREDLLRPDAASPDYLVVMVRGLLFSGSIVGGVQADPELARRSIWSLFEPGPGVQKALLGADRFWDPSNTWRVALVRLALAGLLDAQRLTDAATLAAADERMGRNHRAWYRKIPELLADPLRLPDSPEGGAPPPGNQLY